MSSKMITKIMSEKGPVVEVVILKVDGSIKQKKLDMTPSLNQAAKAIDAKSATFIGQLPASQVVIMKNRDSKGLKKNAHIHGKEANDVFNRFKEPDEDDEDATGEHKGDLLLVKMDDDAIPQSFTKENYLKYLSDYADGLLEEEDEEEEDEEIDEDEDEDEEEGDGDEEDDEQEEDDGELSPKVEKMLNLILAEYKIKYKKNPTLEKLHKFITEFVESETESEAEIIQYILDDIETDLNKESSKKREREDKKESKPKNQPAIQSKKSKKA